MTIFEEKIENKNEAYWGVIFDEDSEADSEEYSVEASAFDSEEYSDEDSAFNSALDTVEEDAEVNSEAVNGIELIEANFD